MKAGIKLSIIVVASAVLTPYASAQAATLTVGPGLIYDFTSVQSAIYAAKEGDTILVAMGTYKEKVVFNGSNIVLTSTDPNDSAVVEGTVIKAYYSAPVLTLTGNEDASCELRGLTITNGRMSGIWGNGTKAAISNCVISGNSTDYDGGGLHDCDGPISDCIIADNSAVGTRGQAGKGGGLYGCDGPITKCIIRNNEAGRGSLNGYGGGLHSCQGAITNCTISGNSANGTAGGLHSCHGAITSCTITGNSAVGDGGGLYDCDGPISGCTISDNRAEHPSFRSKGGGVCRCDGTITACTISDNEAYESGGGLYGCNGRIENCTILRNRSTGWNGGGLSQCRVIINCVISDNWAVGSGGGLERCPTVSNCTISGNRADLYAGGGLSQCQSVRNSVIAGNSAGTDGGGLDRCHFIANCLISGSIAAGNGGALYECAEVFNCTVTGNRAAKNGGAIYYSGNDGVAANCILWDNRATEGDQVYLGACVPTRSGHLPGMPVYSDIYGGVAGVYVVPGCTLDWEPSNIQTDPRFVQHGHWSDDGRWTDGDYHLLPSSPCINSGHPESLPQVGETDLDANPRIVGGIVDMGAYEFQQELPGWRIWYIDTVNGNDDNDGLTPETAFATIQRGVNSAVDGDTVIVADGTYTGQGNRDINLKGKAITLRSENGAANCVIDCMRAGRGFYFGHGEDTDTVVEGFTIVNGVADNGGGVYCSSSPTISHCIIRLNEAKHGAGLATQDFAEPTIDNCLICENSCTGFGGGGIDCHSASPTIINCTIADNSTKGEGGAIAARGSSNPILTNCILWADSPYETSLAGGASASLTYCDVQGGWPGEGNIDADPRFAEIGEGLVSHWTFDEGEGDMAYDSAGTNDGIIRGAQWATGQVGAALNFDGYEDYVTLADNSFDDLGSNVTFCAWVYRNETGPKHYTILGYGDSESDHWFFYLPIVDDVIAYALRKGRGSYDDCWYRGSTHIGAHEWYHIVVVTSSTGAAAYINGQQDTFTKQTISECPGIYGFPDIRADAETATIGILIRLSGTVHPFDGKIDELMIFDRALSAGEVQRLYQDSLASPAAHWRFDEAEGEIAYDSVGDNHGTIHGARWTAGQTEGALDFDGVDDYVDVDDPLDIGLDTNYSVSAWVNIHNMLPTYGVVAAYRHQSSPSVVFQLDRAAADVRFIVRDDAGNIAIATGFEALAPDSWHHVVGVRRGDDLSIYVNGQEGTSSSNEFGEMIPNGLKFGAIECCGFGVHHHFNGSIDDVRIYDQALSVEEVQSLSRPSLRSKRSDYRLSADSPCIDAGDPEYQPERDTKDINGNPRVTGDAIDMGAFESQPLIEVHADKFLFEGVAGHPNPPDQILLLHNAGAGNLNWQISCDCSWLEVDPNSGRSKGYGNTVWLRADTTGLAAGEYDCELTIWAPFVTNSPHIVKVSLIVEKNCFPDTPDYARQYADFLQYVAHGADPSCWCASPWDGTHYQCDGDASGKHQSFTKYRVYGDDLVLLINNWKRKIDTADPCADFDHKAESFLNYRVYGNDLAILIANWKKRDADLPGDCPRPDSQ